jgi:hypothetical protein
MDERPFRERYYAILGVLALSFAVFRLAQQDWAVGITLAVVAVVLLTVARWDRG